MIFLYIILIEVVVLSKPIIKVRHLDFHYRNFSKLVLKDISFQVLKGSWTSIVGTNGSGKSTLIRLIDGLLAPQRGRIQINGHWLTAKNVWQLRSKIGVVFQNPADQFVNTTVKDDLAFGLENFQIPSRQMDSIIKASLRLVGMLAFKDALLQDLSGGQQQRVALAEILAIRPAIVIFDESTSMLNPLSRYRVLRLIKRLKDSFDLTVLDITHNIEETKYADQIIVLRHGRLIMNDSPRRVFSCESELKRAGLIPPQIDVLKDLLIQKGLPLPQHHLSETEMISWLRQWF